MFEDYLIIFLTGLFLGLFSPFMFKRFILPKFSDWLQEKVDGWRKLSNQIGKRGRPKGSKNKPKEEKK
jgi:hypothetical protein